MTGRFITCGLALVACIAACWLLRGSPEPADEPDGFVKLPYHCLVGRRFVAVALGCSLLLSLLVATPRLSLLALAWSLTAGCGSVLVLCDQCTTYLPSRLLRPLRAVVWLLVAAQVALDQSHPVGRVIVGTVACTALFWGLWRLGAGLGFADVRLVATLSPLTAATSARTCMTALLAGTVLGAVAGVITAVWRRRHPSPLGSGFAYGPALFLGAWAAFAMA